MPHWKNDASRKSGAWRKWKSKPRKFEVEVHEAEYSVWFEMVTTCLWPNFGFPQDIVSQMFTLVFCAAWCVWVLKVCSRLSSYSLVIWRSLYLPSNLQQVVDHVFREGCVPGDVLQSMGSLGVLADRCPDDVSILSDLSSWVAWQLNQLVVAFACAVLHMPKGSLCERV